MEMLELNETPVRTARNFKINSIQLENVEIPEKVAEFKNVEIKGNLTVIEKVTAKIVEVLNSLTSAVATVGGIDFKGHKHKDAEQRDTSGAIK